MTFFYLQFLGCLHPVVPQAILYILNNDSCFPILSLILLFCKVACGWVNLLKVNLGLAIHACKICLFWLLTSLYWVKAGSMSQPSVWTRWTNSEVREGDLGDVSIVFAGTLLTCSELPYTFVDLKLFHQICDNLHQLMLSKDILLSSRDSRPFCPTLSALCHQHGNKVTPNLKKDLKS